MLESGVVIVSGKPVFWHNPDGRTSVHLPDSDLLWSVLWRNRETVEGFAHSHPGVGIPTPSYEDLTTFRAIERALGRRIKWWITSRTNAILLRWDSESQENLGYVPEKVPDSEEPDWIWKLRENSYVPDPSQNS